LISCCCCCCIALQAEQSTIAGLEAEIQLKLAEAATAADEREQLNAHFAQQTAMAAELFSSLETQKQREQEQEAMLQQAQQQREELQEDVAAVQQLLQQLQGQLQQHSAAYADLLQAHERLGQQSQQQPAAAAAAGSAGEEVSRMQEEMQLLQQRLQAADAQLAAQQQRTVLGALKAADEGRHAAVKRLAAQELQESESAMQVGPCVDRIHWPCLCNPCRCSCAGLVVCCLRFWDGLIVFSVVI
jgi:septal ring factor EnvC (AmiA/AmiB activator)